MLTLEGVLNPQNLVYQNIIIYLLWLSLIGKVIFHYADRKQQLVTRYEYVKKAPTSGADTGSTLKSSAIEILQSTIDVSAREIISLTEVHLHFNISYF